MAVRDAVTTIRSDPAWLRKLGIGALVAHVPYVGGITVMGWAIDHERAVAWRTATGLPEWGDWIERAKNGLFGYLPGMIYVGVISIVASIPFSFLLVAAILATVAPAIAAGPSAAQSPAFPLTVYAVTMVATLGFSLLPSVITLPLIQVPLAHYEVWRDLGAALKPRLTWQQIRRGGRLFRRAWGFGAAYIAVAIAVGMLAFVPLFATPFYAAFGTVTTTGLGVALGAMILGGLLYLALLLVAPAAIVVQAHLWGEWAREEYDLENALATAPAA